MGGPTEDAIAMSLQSQQGNAQSQGVVGGECERGLNPLTGGGSGGPPLENFQNLGAFSCNLGIPQPYFQAY